MNFFKISEQHMQTIAGILGKFPAEHVLPAIDILRSLEKIEIVEDVKEAV